MTLTGAELDGFRVDEPAASVRLLLPPAGEGNLVMPSWNGNEFLLPDGSRPAIRTFTPRRSDPEARELDVDIVLHEGGVASAWVEAAQPGDAVAVSGPGRGYTVEQGPERPVRAGSRAATGFLLGGDETAIPAVSQLLEVLPVDRPVQVHLEVAHPDARLPLPAHPDTTVEWHDSAPGAAPGDALVAAVRAAGVAPGTQVWAAGEAAAMQRIRRHLFDERGFARRETTIRGYWKQGRGGDADEG